MALRQNFVIAMLFAGAACQAGWSEDVRCGAAGAQDSAPRRGNRCLCGSWTKPIHKTILYKGEIIGLRARCGRNLVAVAG